MTRFVDYAWWQVSPAQLRALGFSGAMRYCSHDGSKDLTAAEVANLRAADFDIGIIYESVANRAAQGVAAGAADGTFANTFADALGYPRTATLWYAVDFDGSPSQVQPYFDGISSAGGRPYAPYGSAGIIDGVRYPGIGWQTAAWSRGRVSTRAGLLQDQFSGSYDGNRVLVADFGQWRAGDSPTPTPVPEEDDDMLLLAADGKIYLVGGFGKAWMDDPDGVSQLVKKIGPVINVSVNDLRRIPDGLPGTNPNLG